MNKQNEKQNRIRRFGKSFRPVVDDIAPTESCSLKRHYRGVLRELIGYVDYLAELDPKKERFVFAHVDALAAGCKKFANKTLYSKTAIEKGLSEFRARHIISKRLTRIRNGEEKTGFIVAPHDCLAVPGQGGCVFKGQLRAPGRWERSPGSPCAEHSTYNVECKNCKAGVIFWAGFPQVASQHPAIQPRQGNDDSTPVERWLVSKSTEESTAKCTDVFAKCTDECTEAHSSQDAENTDGLLQKSGPNLPSRGYLSVEAELTVDNSSHVSGASSLKSMNDETLGQHFDLPWGILGKQDFSDVTDGVLNTDTKQWKEFGYEGISNLRDCCNEVIRDFATQPYLGRKTDAMIMDLAMKRFNGKYGKVPSSWLKVMTMLRGNQTAAAPRTGIRAEIR